MSMLEAYRKAATIAATTAEPAHIVSRTPRRPIERAEFDAVSAEEFRTNPRHGDYFDTVAPEED